MGPVTPPDDRGLTVWLTGLPSAGKSTVALGVAQRLSASRRVQILDGDDLRRSLSRDLGFGRADRAENVRRIGFVARLLSAHGVVTLVPVIARFADGRAEVRAEHERWGVGFVEVYVSAPVEVCAARDVKGLYAEQRAGTIRQLSGVDDPYEVPQRPDLMLPTHRQSTRESVDALLAEIRARLSPISTPAAARADRPSPPETTSGR